MNNNYQTKYSLRTRDRREARVAPNFGSWPTYVKGYKVERELGTGSFAVVHLVHIRNAAHKKAAMKTIELTGFDDDKWVRLCRAEVDALQLLDHPNIIKCFAAIEDEDLHRRARLTLILEYANRSNLEQLLTDTYFKRQKRLPEREIWRIFAQIAAAMSHVHNKRILHRDLKPANVLFDGIGRTVKVCDFGLCRLFSQNTIKANTQVGTPYYVSPERSYQSGYNFASDVWSMGCILYEMACGGSPFVGERANEFALNLRIQNAEYPPLPDGHSRTPHLKLLISLCLQLDFSKRPSASQVQRYADKMNAFFSR